MMKTKASKLYFPAISIILYFLISGLLFSSCSTKSKTVTIKEFTKQYLDSLTARFPGTSFSLIDDSTIKSGFQGNDIKIMTENAYREYKAQPDSILNVINKYAAVAGDLQKLKEKVKPDQVVPVIKPMEFLDAIKNMGTNPDSVKGSCVYDQYNDQLIIAYAENNKNSIRYLTEDDLLSLNIPRDSLKRHAIRNLDRILPEITRNGGDGFFMLTAGGDFEASMILLPNILNKESLPVNGDFVIAIPNRDMFLITGSNNKAEISKLRELAKKSYNEENYPVSEYLYKWNGKRFEKYD
jgi:uncharacterized protein YtpQ (UPF0354 family)